MGNISFSSNLLNAQWSLEKSDSLLFQSGSTLVQLKDELSRLSASHMHAALCQVTNLVKLFTQLCLQPMRTFLSLPPLGLATLCLNYKWVMRWNWDLWSPILRRQWPSFTCAQHHWEVSLLEFMWKACGKRFLCKLFYPDVPLGIKTAYFSSWSESSLELSSDNISHRLIPHWSQRVLQLLVSLLLHIVLATGLFPRKSTQSVESEVRSCLFIGIKHLFYHINISRLIHVFPEPLKYNCSTIFRKLTGISELTLETFQTTTFQTITS